MTDFLKQFRAEIDAIDDKLVELLLARAEIVKKVGALKDSEGEKYCHIRPGREAEMVRRMYGRFKGSKFNAEAAAIMWRMIIAASTRLESDLKISALYTETHQEAYWLAREYFGSFVPIAKHLAPSLVVGDVLDGKAAVGVLPLPDLPEAENWWRLLLRQEPDRPRIFARIPFVQTSKTAPAMLAFARVAPEPTGDDISVIVVETDGNTSQSRVHSVLDKAGLKTLTMHIHETPVPTRFHLVEVEGFVTSDKPEWQKFLSDMGPSVLNTGLLGSYANVIQT